MNESISNNKKVTIFLFAFTVYCVVNFLQASGDHWGTWSFEPSFKESLKIGLAYLLVDLLGGDAVAFIKGILRYLKFKKP